jgi:lysyl-tRNA synthetase class I
MIGCKNIGINTIKNFSRICKIQEEAYDDAIPVELWIEQNRISELDISSSKTTINSINEMLVNKGAALPIKKYVK